MKEAIGTGGNFLMDNNNNQNNNQNNNNNRNNFRLAPMLVAILVVLLIISYFTRAVSSDTTREISYTEFLTMLEAGEIKEVLLDSDRITFTPVAEEDKGPYGNRVTVTYVVGYTESRDTLS